MPDQKRPNDNSRWSTRGALDEPARGSGAWGPRHLWARLVLLTYHPTFRKHRKVWMRLAVVAALALALLLGARLGGFDVSGNGPGATSPHQQPPGREKVDNPQASRP
jgi:hypothetical protein